MSDLDALAEQIKAMTPGDQLRVAAALLDTREPSKVRLGHTVARRVVEECGAALAHARGSM